MLDQIPGFRPRDRGTATTLVELTAKRRKAWMAAAFGCAVAALPLIGRQFWGGICRPLTEQGFPVKDVSGSLREALFAPAGAAGVPAMFTSPGITAHARFTAWRHHG